jgi:hypothetical protein
MVANFQPAKRGSEPVAADRTHRGDARFSLQPLPSGK